MEQETTAPVNCLTYRGRQASSERQHESILFATIQHAGQNWQLQLLKADCKVCVRHRLADLQLSVSDQCTSPGMLPDGPTLLAE